MATEEGGGMEDVGSALEEDTTDSKGLFGRLKDKYVDFHTVEEDPDSWGEKQAFNEVSRRGFLSLAGQTAAAGYGIAEATDGDGFAVDWSSGQAQPTGPGSGGGAGAPGNETEDGNGQQTPTTGGNQLGVQGDVSDELYLQDDGTVIAIDHGHKEWRAFRPEEFDENSDYASLYAELEDSRDETSLSPPSLESGIEVSKQELFQYDTEAYDDMADEAEWDLIFDSNPNYDG
jgi:hypothetical protein